MKLCLCVGILVLALGLSAQAQWSTKWLQDEAYWGDGKAEFNVYEAQEIRYGQPRRSNVIHIYERGAFAPEELAEATDPKQPALIRPQTQPGHLHSHRCVCAPLHAFVLLEARYRAPPEGNAQWQ